MYLVQDTSLVVSCQVTEFNFGNLKINKQVKFKKGHYLPLHEPGDPVDPAAIPGPCKGSSLLSQQLT